MGREIRRVPPNWQHPKIQTANFRTGQMEESYRPMFNRVYSDDISEWIEQHLLWESGQHPDQLDGSGSGVRYYAEYGGNPPEHQYYRPDWNPADMTWFQVYETVSEGTPVTPPFETREELVEYLVENGDFWDQKRRGEGSTLPCAPWTRKAAEAFVFGNGWAPSFVVEDGRFMSGVEAMREDHNENDIHH